MLLRWLQSWDWLSAGQDKEIAAAAARYVWLCVPALPFIAGTECIRR